MTMNMIENMIIAMTQIHHGRDQNTHPFRPNRVDIVVNVIIVVRRQVVSIKNHHGDAVQVVAVIVAAIHVTLIDHENVRSVNGHRPMIKQVDQAKAVTNVRSIREKRVTLEVIATKKVDIEQFVQLHLEFHVFFFHENNFHGFKSKL